MSKPMLRVAIVGYGLAGSVFHAPLVAATPGMHVTAIVTGNPERQAQAGRDFPSAAILPTADDLWKHPDRHDLVVIGTPNRTHLPLGRAALEAGLPVVIDKPLATSAAAGEELVTLAVARGVPLTVFHNRRWDGDFLTIRALLATNRLGQVVRFESRFERFRPLPKPGSWRELPDPQEGGGLLFDLGSHLIDQALLLFGLPTTVYAECEVRRPGALVDDDTFLALQFGNGVRAHLWMNTVVRLPAPRFHISGMRGSYRKFGLDPQEAVLKAGGRPGEAEWGEEPRTAWGHLSTDLGPLHFDGAVETLPGSYQSFYAGVRDALLGLGPMPVDPQDAITTLQVIEAAQLSAREGRVVQFAGEAGR